MFGGAPGFDQIDIRLFFTVLRGALAIILLSDISFHTTYPVISESTILHAGLSPLNTSIANLTGFNEDATSEFWGSFTSIMTDPAVTTVPPLSCSGPSCQAYFLPGTMSIVDFGPSLEPIQKDNFTVFIVNDAPGYQIEYSPVTTADPPLVDTDCEIYGVPWAAIQICIKKAQIGFISGMAFNVELRFTNPQP